MRGLSRSKANLSGSDEPELGRGLSVEMASKRYVKSLIVSDEVRGRVLFEANIGNLIGLSSVDGRVLEVRGTNGTLRVDLTEEELEAMLSKVRSTRSALSCLAPSRGAGRNRQKER